VNPFPKMLHFDNAGWSGTRRRVILTAPFPAITSLGWMEAPTGFVSDGGSIPRFAWSIVGDGFDDCLEQFVIHDLLYSPLNTNYSRAEADFIMKELLWNCGVNRFRIAAFYAAVRFGGGSHFKAKIKSL
jgi:hypothetical protein